MKVVITRTCFLNLFYNMFLDNVSFEDKYIIPSKWSFHSSSIAFLLEDNDFSH